MEQQKSPTPNRDRQQQPTKKQPWHRPQLTFVALTTTAFNTGSPIDGFNSGTAS